MDICINYTSDYQNDGNITMAKSHFTVMLIVIIVVTMVTTASLIFLIQTCRIRRKTYRFEPSHLIIEDVPRDEAANNIGYETTSCHKAEPDSSNVILRLRGPLSTEDDYDVIGPSGNTPDMEDKPPNSLISDSKCNTPTVGSKSEALITRTNSNRLTRMIASVSNMYNRITNHVDHDEHLYEEVDLPCDKQTTGLTKTRDSIKLRVQPNHYIVGNTTSQPLHTCGSTLNL